MDISNYNKLERMCSGSQVLFSFLFWGNDGLGNRFLLLSWFIFTPTFYFEKFQAYINIYKKYNWQLLNSAAFAWFLCVSFILPEPLKIGCKHHDPSLTNILGYFF